MYITYGQCAANSFRQSVQRRRKERTKYEIPQQNNYQNYIDNAVYTFAKRKINGLHVINK